VQENSDLLRRRISITITLGQAALATSGKFAEISKKNIYPHHLGSSGYVGKVGEWKKKLKETVTAGKPNLLEGVEERTQH
jgi:hypothetical protein